MKPVPVTMNSILAAFNITLNYELVKSFVKSCKNLISW